ncbi:hypothetical protein KI387_013424 [Taxus chinensis]|uniref:DYW domain-containing protein n=1 Tax=Taxus chinensis TaxID=29808 RepID=A0AA38FHG8_TAXCH|nr:hypothetical protein KI387_013424 [Taxus chinensis]
MAWVATVPLHPHSQITTTRQRLSGSSTPQSYTQTSIAHTGVYKTTSENGKLRFTAPDENYTYFHLLQDYPSIKSIENPRKSHAHIIKKGIEAGVSLSNYLIRCYVKSGELEDARRLFDKMPERDISSWGHIIAGYAKNRCGFEAFELICLLRRHSRELSEFIITSAVHACTSLDDEEQGKQVHAYAIKSRLACGVGIGTALITMYLKSGNIDYARKVFDKMSKPNIVSCTAMIGGYAKNQLGEEAFQLFSAMRCSEQIPNQFTFASVLSALTAIGDLEKGKGVHAHAIKTGFQIYVCVGSALVTLYVKCGSMDDAFKVFEDMPTRNVVSWTAMIAGYAQNKCGEEALRLFTCMLRTRVKPNEFTFSGVLSACSTQSALRQGKEVHAQIVRNGFQSNLIVSSALITMYSSCSITEYARSIFERMTELNTVAWTAMIAGYAQNGQSEEALKQFIKMRQKGLKPNQFAFASVLRACASLANLGQGKQLHAFLVKTRFMSDISATNALVTMYAKCGSIDDAHDAFNEMPDRDLVSWNAIIAGYAQHGNGRKALQIFQQMQRTGIRPDHITFVGVLSACSKVGLVEKGRYYFGTMSQEHGIIPCLEHYTCMVDLLGRAGLLDEAKEVIDEMPLKPDVRVWRALLRACRIHGDMKLIESAAECLLKLEPDNASTYMLLSKAYAATERWDLVEKIRKMIEDRGVKKKPGWSCIEVNKHVHTFIAGDRAHPQADEIYAKIEELRWKMEEVGYVPNMKLVLHDVEEEQNEQLLCYHSEKLAIAFGLLRTSSEMPIRVVKDLRVCGDCHAASKLISKIVGREIVLRDTNQFHHFKDGFCSCGDYW